MSIVDLIILAGRPLTSDFLGSLVFIYVIIFVVKKFSLEIIELRFRSFLEVTATQTALISELICQQAFVLKIHIARFKRS